MRKLLLSTALLLVTAQSANAVQWQVDPAKSALTFSGKQADESFNGSFKKFTADIDFDETAPEKGKIHITVDIASATIDGKDRQDALPTDDWLGASKFPTAEFTSTSISKTATHQYAALGNLSLHGMTKQITLPFTLTPEEKATHAEGEFTLKRDDYKIGAGRWADDTWIAFPVTVRYGITATPK